MILSYCPQSPSQAGALGFQVGPEAGEATAGAPLPLCSAMHRKLCTGLGMVPDTVHQHGLVCPQNKQSKTQAPSLSSQRKQRFKSFCPESQEHHSNAYTRWVPHQLSGPARRRFPPLSQRRWHGPGWCCGSAQTRPCEALASIPGLQKLIIYKLPEGPERQQRGKALALPVSGAQLFPPAMLPRRPARARPVWEQLGPACFAP